MNGSTWRTRPSRVTFAETVSSGSEPTSDSESTKRVKEERVKRKKEMKLADQSY